MKEEIRLGRFDKWGYKNSFSKGELARELTYMNRDYDNLQSQLKAKEEVIKEAREYIDTKVISNGEIIDQLRKIEVKKLLEILSKGENK